MLAMPLELPDSLLHPYVRRDDFQFQQSVIDKYLPDPMRGLYTGPGLAEIDPLLRASPMASKDGPIADTGSPFITQLSDPSKLPRYSSSGVDYPNEPEYGDIARSMYEQAKYGDMGMTAGEGGKELPYIFDHLVPGSINLMQSHSLRQMAGETERLLIHPDDAVPPPYSSGPLELPPNYQAMKEPPIIETRTGFEADAHQIALRVAVDPATMHFDRVLGKEAMAEREGPRERGHGLGSGVQASCDPRTDATLQPILTGGVCIGIRCSDGVVLAADTMVCYGSLQLYREARRLHKITDDIIMVAEGEYSDFQELQTMFQELIDEHHYLPPVGTYRMRPKQAFEFLTQVMYNRRNKMDPLWNTVLMGGYGKPCGEDYPAQNDHLYKEEPFLGMVDMHGTQLVDHILTTGIGQYMALPLLREATREVERLKQHKLPDTLNTTQGIQLLCDVMRVLSLRTSRCSNRIQIGKVSANGAELSAPFRVEGNWTFEGFNKQEHPLHHQARGQIWPF